MRNGKFEGKLRKSYLRGNVFQSHHDNAVSPYLVKGKDIHCLDKLCMSFTYAHSLRHVEEIYQSLPTFGNFRPSPILASRLSNNFSLLSISLESAPSSFLKVLFQRNESSGRFSMKENSSLHIFVNLARNCSNSCLQREELYGKVLSRAGRFFFKSFKYLWKKWSEFQFNWSNDQNSFLFEFFFRFWIISELKLILRLFRNEFRNKIENNLQLLQSMRTLNRATSILLKFNFNNFTSKEKFPANQTDSFRQLQFNSYMLISQRDSQP